MVRSLSGAPSLNFQRNYFDETNETTQAESETAQAHPDATQETEIKMRLDLMTSEQLRELREHIQDAEIGRIPRPLSFDPSRFFDDESTDRAAKVRARLLEKLDREIG